MDSDDSTAPFILQVFGANTDVGKTVISAGLLKAHLSSGVSPNAIHYIKPIQTGSITDAAFMSRYIEEVSGMFVGSSFFALMTDDL